MVSPSAYEGFGLTFIEAMAAGCPVLGLRNSSVPEVVGGAGLLIDDAETGTLAAAIESLVTNEGLRGGLRERGLRRASTFSWTATAERTAEVYARVLSEYSR